MFELKEKISIITGGGSGIGRAISELFAARGSVVHILDVDPQAGEVAAAIRAGGHSAFYHECDVSSQQAVLSTVNAIGNIHILVNNAGIAHIGTVETTAEEDFDRLFRVNVKGMYNCIHAVIGGFKKDGGVIVNMASIAASVGIPDRFAYSMTKAAVVGMTLSVARDFVQQKIRCNCISPARVHTPFVDGFLKKNFAGREQEMFEKLSKTQPIGRMATAEEVAALALFLCSDEAAFITGCDYLVDGGFTKLNN
jgi:2-keto-3-deoxy-L-fuconate dehydrogenase